jgi:hypothetical protein
MSKQESHLKGANRLLQRGRYLEKDYPRLANLLKDPPTFRHPWEINFDEKRSSEDSCIDTAKLNAKNCHRISEVERFLKQKLHKFAVSADEIGTFHTLRNAR